MAVEDAASNFGLSIHELRKELSSIEKKQTGMIRLSSGKWAVKELMTQIAKSRTFARDGTMMRVYFAKYSSHSVKAYSARMRAARSP